MIVTPRWCQPPPLNGRQLAERYEGTHICRSAKVHTGYRPVCTCGWGGGWYDPDDKAGSDRQRDEHRRRYNPAALLTKRQYAALLWLRRVGKASSRTCRRHGFQPRTLDVLVEKGFATASNINDRGRPVATLYRVAA